MTTVTAGSPITLEEGPSHRTATGVSNSKLAMWFFIAGDCFLFGALISVYFLYRGRSIEGPQPRDIYDIPFTSVSSFILILSSLTMVLALSAGGRNEMRKMRVWLMATAMLGATFLAGQIYEFTSFAREGLTMKTNLFGSSFFLLTGFHGAHVAVGVLMLVAAAILSRRGVVRHRNVESIEIVGLYWHFVDVVWIVIFVVVYLLPQPGGNS